MGTDTVLRRFAARLHNLRMEKGLSQAALASKSKLTTNYISQLERATKIPSLTTLVQLAHGLAVDLPSLVDFPDLHGKAEDRTREEIELLNRKLQRHKLDTIRRVRKAVDILFD